MNANILKKIKIKEDFVELHLARSKRESDKEQTTYISPDAPHPDLLEAMKVLENYVREMLELPTNVWAGGIMIVAVHFKLDEEMPESGAVGAQVSAKISSGGFDSPLSITTPYLPFRAANDCDGKKTMPEIFKESFLRVQKEGILYLQGKRAQGDMFLES